MSLVVDIRKQFKGFILNVNFETNGEYLAILGKSGSGKSMTLKCIAGIETPDEGKIIYNEKILFDSERKINLKPQERNIGYMFQNYALFPNMTVEENIGSGLKAPKKEKLQKVTEMINSFHLKGLEKKYPNQLSGGQQQRVALARCMAYKPDMLLLDEPFSALDSHLKEQLQAEVLDLLKLYDGKIVMVTHSMDEAYKFCKKLVIIDKGSSVLTGDTKEVFNQPKLMSAALITGCKNISGCNLITPDSVYAIDWGIVLKTDKKIQDNIKFVGIREHSFQIADSIEDTNTFFCNINRITEEVFEYSISFTDANNKSENSLSLLFKVRKDIWDNRKNKERLLLKVPKEAVLLLEQ